MILFFGSIICGVLGLCLVGAGISPRVGVALLLAFPVLNVLSYFY